MEKAYSNNIRPYDLFEVRYKGLRIVPTRNASRELAQLRLMLHDCKRFLEEGYDAPRKRAANSEEKWFDRGRKTFNVVVVRAFDHLLREEVWLLKHAGQFARKTGRGMTWT